jgi:hypothetical protein
MVQPEQVKQGLNDLLPPDVASFLDAGGWWVVAGVAGLVVFLLWAALGGRLWRALFGGRRGPAVPSDQDLFVDLETCPLPVRPPADFRLTVYHIPARLRLVVVAPLGKDATIDATAVEELLDHVLPGLSSVVYDDKPRVRVWPPELSHTGFGMAFRRRVQRPEPDGELSRWVLAAGRAQSGRHTILLGLGLWADEPNTLGQLSLELHQWRDVLRLRPTGD